MNEKKLHIAIPAGAASIIDVLEQNGYEGYVVGGCVRDAVLGRTPNDWDITTSATPDDMHRLFAHTVDTGAEHGTVTVLVDHVPFEVTTYRIDGKYEDGRHPAHVTFTPSLTEDLRRRDFTINAMAYNDRTGLVDLFGGLEDLRAGVVRCVGNARERFTEDALRMMRAVRFAAQLSFSLDEDTAGAIAQLAPSLSRISAERIRDELVKTLISDRPQMVDLFRSLGLTKVFLPEYDALFASPLVGPHHDSPTVGDHTLRVLSQVERSSALRLAALLHDIGKPAVAGRDAAGNDIFPGHAAQGERTTGEILQRLRFDNRTMNLVRTLIRFHSALPSPDEAAVRRFAAAIGPERMEAYFDLKRADVLSQSRAIREERLQILSGVRRIWEMIRARGDCLCIKDLAITGDDLIADGMKRGRQIGEVLANLLEAVLTDPARNTREELLRLAREQRDEAAGCACLPWK